MSERIVFSVSKRVLLHAAMVLSAAVMLVGVGYFAGARASIPADSDALVYTGVLTKHGALVDETEAISVAIFDSSTAAGNRLCGPVDQPSTRVTQGRFSVALPASCVTAVRGNADAFIEVQVGGIPVGVRTHIGAVPFAVEADHATAADSSTTANRADDLVCSGCVGTAALAASAVDSAEVKDGAITQAKAPFAPLVRRGDELLANPIVFATSIQLIVQPQNPDEPDPGADDQTISYASAGFTSTPICVLTNGDFRGQNRDLSLGLVNGDASTAQLRAFRAQGGSLVPGDPYRINVMCIGR